MNPAKEEISKLTNPNKEKGSLKEVIKKADVFIGVSAPNILAKEDIVGIVNMAELIQINLLVKVVSVL